MPQPVKHTPDVMLDAARALILRSGPAAATASAVASACGAPSGSVYHRFPRRDDLVAAAWIRAQDRFRDAYLREITQPRPDAGVAAAVVVLTWSGDNPEDASLLLRHSLHDLLRGDVAPELDKRAQANQELLSAAVTRFAATTDRALADVLLAVVDLPYATTRRVLRDRRPPTGQQVRSLERAASLLLERAPETPRGVS